MSAEQGPVQQGERPVRAPWSGLVIVVAWLAAYLCFFLVAGLLRSAGWFPGSEDAGEAGKLSRLRLTIWATLLAVPLQVLSAIYLVRSTSEARLADLGLTTRRLGRHLLAGLALTAVLAPLVYGIQFLVEALMRQLPGAAVQEHPFTLLAREGNLSSADWVALVLAAVLAAPLWEELLFRGLLQPWIIDRPAAAGVLLGLAVALGLLLRHEEIAAAWQLHSPERWLAALLPALAALALLPIYLLLRRFARSGVPAGILATSALFGWFHAGVWPSPVALTMLGLGLGWLARRSGSLVGPFVLHAGFNSIACVLLLYDRP